MNITRISVSIRTIYADISAFIQSGLRNTVLSVYNSNGLEVSSREAMLDSIQQQLLDVLDRSGAKLHALLTRLTLRQDTAEDLLQELFVKLDHVARTQTIHNWDAYAREAAIHLAFDWRRRRKRAGPSLDDMPEPACDELSPLGRLVRDEQIQEILSAIGQLNGSARQAFVLRYIEQESYETIAASMNKTPHQVRALCSKVMQWLRSQMGESDTPCEGKDRNHAAAQ